MKTKYLAMAQPEINEIIGYDRGYTEELRIDKAAHDYARRQNRTMYIYKLIRVISPNITTQSEEERDA